MKKFYSVILMVAVCFTLAVWSLPSRRRMTSALIRHVNMWYGQRHLQLLRMLIEYDDGNIAAFCSLHCAAVDMANNIDKTRKRSRSGILITSSLSMPSGPFGCWRQQTRRDVQEGKWAFENRSDAENFMKANQARLFPSMSSEDGLRRYAR